MVNVSDEAGFLQIANSSEFGLAASVYGDEGAAYRIMKHLDSGMVHCNGSTIHDIQQRECLNCFRGALRIPC